MLTGWIEQKRRYRKYKQRMAQLPEPYQASIDALERYLMYLGPGQGEDLVTMLEDLAELFEQSVANHTTIREIVGDDVVAFTEAFLQNYPSGQWISQERERLKRVIDRVTTVAPHSAQRAAQ